MLNRSVIIISALGLLLSGCLPSFQQEEEVDRTNKGDGEKVIVLPNIKSAEEYYQSVLPFEPSEARGLVLYGLNSRLDIDELEIGLMRLSQQTLSPETYYFQEGQYLKGSEVNSWLKRASDHINGLNPPLDLKASDSWQEKIAKHKQAPSYLSYILEHNYLIKKNNNSVELGGLVLGISLNSIYYIDVEDDAGLKYFDELPLNDENVKKQGKVIAEKILERVRNMKEFADVPIVIGLFKEAPKGSIVPGTFFAKTVVKPGSNKISKWENINEAYYLFPSKAATDYDREMAEKFNYFKEEVAKFFPNYVGIIGKGFYKNDSAQRLVIDIPIQFYGKAEVISFTQWVTGLIMNDAFPDNLLLEVNISSLSGPESLIVLKPGDKHPLVHIYR